MDGQSIREMALTALELAGIGVVQAQERVAAARQALREAEDQLESNTKTLNVLQATAETTGIGVGEILDRMNEIVARIEVLRTKLCSTT